MLKKGERERDRERTKDREKPREESLRFKIVVFCSRRRSTFHDKREGPTTTTTTTSSPPKTPAPVSHPLPAGMEDKGAMKNGEIEFKSEHRENENIPGSKAKKDGSR